MSGDVYLRDIAEEDLGTLFQFQLERRAVEMAAFPSRGFDAFIARWKETASQESTLSRAIVFRNQLAGSITSWLVDDDRKIGYWLGMPFWGKGIATAALRLFLTEMNERPITAHVAKHNLASCRVLQKNGFIIVGKEVFADHDGNPAEGLILELAE